VRRKTITVREPTPTEEPLLFACGLREPLVDLSLTGPQTTECIEISFPGMRWQIHKGTAETLFLRLAEAFRLLDKKQDLIRQYQTNPELRNNSQWRRDLATVDPQLAAEIESMRVE
jgi:hypothetical protein